MSRYFDAVGAEVGQEFLDDDPLVRDEMANSRAQKGPVPSLCKQCSASRVFARGTLVPEVGFLADTCQRLLDQSPMEKPVATSGVLATS